jgi:hypothetical protein
VSVAAPHLPRFELGEPACSNDIELARGMLDLVEICHQLIVGQRGVINDQQAVESRTELAHVATNPNMRATLHRTTDARTNNDSDTNQTKRRSVDPLDG